MASNPTGTRPCHHPPPELLLEHAGGCCTQAEALLIARHARTCGECRTGIRDCAAIGGALLDTIEPARLPPNLLNRTLEAIERASRQTQNERKRCAPVALDAEIGPWRRLPGGVRVRRLPIGNGPERLVLMRVRPGGSVLRHRHTGEEWMLVLEGGFSDETGDYRDGDLVVRGAEDEHSPVADPDKGCTCLVLLRGDLRFSGLLGALARPFLKL